MQNDIIKGLEQTIDLFNLSAIAEISAILSHDLQEIKSKLSVDADDIDEQLFDLETARKMVKIVEARLHL